MKFLQNQIMAMPSEVQSTRLKFQNFWGEIIIYYEL